MGVLECHLSASECVNGECGDHLKGNKRGDAGLEVLVGKGESHVLVVVALMPLCIALDIGLVSFVNAPDAEHLSLKHEVGVAIVVGHWGAVNFNGVEVPQPQPVAYVAIVVRAAAQAYYSRYSKDDVCCQSFHLKGEIAVIEYRD